MKKYYFILFFGLTNLLFAQATLQSLEQNTHIKSYIVNKKMFEMMGKMKADASDAKTQSYLNLIKKLNVLQVFTTSHQQASNELTGAFQKQIAANNLQELIRTTHDGKKVKIYANTANKSAEIKELMMLIESTTSAQENVLMRIEGSFRLEEVVILTDKLNLPGSDFIKS